MKATNAVVTHIEHVIPMCNVTKAAATSIYQILD